ncbi:MAG TPA: TetR/AcrR family transcriptional regulator [Candidatus Dormibacteraeota bacterium]|nr:TetR/AcrR family transcriptional regulator [Candidatus Dormibacteraeota bacterium]
MALRKRDSAATRDDILTAARIVLNRDGSGRLSTHSVAALAGVNQSLIHYHFRTREGLLLGVLEQMNAELLDRQRSMYAREDMTLAEKWQQAVDFYRVDLASGYVRTLLELTAHGYSNPAIAARVRHLFDGWRRLLTEVAASALARLGVDDLSADDVVAMVAAYWWGMEVQHLLGVPEEEGHLWAATAKIGRLLGTLETNRRSRRRKR